MSTKTTSIDSWLIDAENLSPGDDLNIYLSRETAAPPTYEAMRNALHAQFGGSTYADVAAWNDKQLSVEPILELFDKAISLAP